ncbi:hypothetical protein GCM10011395_05720 [Sphingomonas psychrolutea]|uniref:Uncharacterized protein n=1 Tax=Sphingomonas psychrolutea TaxID=1259676 RepID=A0ABQ1G7I1_9SPHN|nr:hypothetical protein GCM10011395_05720 [Sphingomonas psychrolutea]
MPLCETDPAIWLDMLIGPVLRDDPISVKFPVSTPAMTPPAVFPFSAIVATLRSPTCVTHTALAAPEQADASAGWATAATGFTPSAPKPNAKVIVAR